MPPVSPAGLAVRFLCVLTAQQGIKPLSGWGPADSTLNAPIFPEQAVSAPGCTALSFHLKGV